MDAPSKTCCTCGLSLPLASFNLRSSSPDGRQSRCRGCSRRWYEVNKVAHKANVRRLAGIRKTLHRARIAEHFASHPCVDCGEADVRCLEFDHRDPSTKSDDVATLLSQAAAWARVRDEIAKCDVRCANCHRRVTADRQVSWRSASEGLRRAGMSAAASARLATVLRAERSS